MVETFASEIVVEATVDLTYKFQNRPRYETPWAYKRARETFLDRIRGAPGVVAVYESGADGPSVPGISDIDLIVVVSDELESPELVRKRIRDAKVDEYFFFHGPEVVTQSMFSEYYNVLPMPKALVHLQGEELSYEQNREKYNYLAYLVDQVNSTYPMEFLEFLLLPGVSIKNQQFNIFMNDLIDLVIPGRIANALPVQIDTRMAIHRLNSLRNDFNLFRQTTRLGAHELSRFDETITSLRQEWFDLGEAVQNDRLKSRLEDAVTACFVFIDQLQGHLSDCGIGTEGRTKEYRSSDIYTNLYTSDWRRTDAERETVTNYRRRRVKSCILPQIVSVNERLRGSTSKVTAPDDYIDALRYRDRAKRRRDESMEAYKYHPLRGPYMSVFKRLNWLKTRASL